MRLILVVRCITTRHWLVCLWVDEIILFVYWQDRGRRMNGHWYWSSKQSFTLPAKDSWGWLRCWYSSQSQILFNTRTDSLFFILFSQSGFWWIMQCSPGRVSICVQFSQCPGKGLDVPLCPEASLKSTFAINSPLFVFSSIYIRRHFSIFLSFSVLTFIQSWVRISSWI